jgi:NADH-quinone oxidoreductase subunit H
MIDIFHLLVFPGILFSICAGLLAGWIDRKVTARLQWRVGPPWHQNFTDIVKLLGKETILPEGAGMLFLTAPYVGFISALIAASIVGQGILAPSRGFIGDIIVLLYITAMPAVALLIGASASRNPLASVGASREMKLMIAYELPFILAVIAVVIKSSGALQIGQIIMSQQQGSHIFSLSGAMAFFSMLVCVQAKLGLVPFDASEAEQEIMGGVLIEYSGPALALFKLTKAVMLYAMPLVVIVLLMGNDLRIGVLAAKYILLLCIAILIKNTNPRLRIDQAMRFFWRLPLALSVGSVIAALAGL